MSDKTLTPKTEQALENVADRPVFAPRVDIFENDDELRLVADLPGVAAGSLELKVLGGELSLHATRDPEVWRYDFERRFRVPRSIDSENIAADLDGGVLTLHLPKAKAPQPRRIEVRSR